ncbi:MAG: dihydrofolate reductase, partial [Gammaproteobacteria bacterium]|nr:dihydrofolate reductase [Gammaproteobacteria bacterium]
GDNREIGLNNELLWKMPADMKHFRETTMGKPIIVGRKTYESFGAKPLPGRLNIVITRDAAYEGNGATVVTSIDEALQAASNVEEIMVIGGASFYEQFLPKADELILTYVHASFEADAFFPEIDLAQWREVAREDYAADEKNPYDYSFVTYQRKTH